jgi:hypothetical protein
MNGVQPTLIDYQGITMNNSTLERNVTLTMDGTSQGFILQYDKQSLNPKQFTITHSGIDYTETTTSNNNYSTGLQRLAQVHQAFQAVVLPPDSTTLQINNRLLLLDPDYSTVSGSMSVDSGGNVRIDASGNLILNPIGSIETNGKTINMGNGQIHNCDLINSQNNNNIIIEGRGTGGVILKTDDTNRLTISDSGAWTVQGGLSYNNATGVMSFPSPPTCIISATTSNQLLNFENFTATSWTPTVSGFPTTGNPSYQSQRGRYILINKLCVGQGEFQLSGLGGLGVNVLVSLPVQCSSTVPVSLAIAIVNGMSTNAVTDFKLTADPGASRAQFKIRTTTTSGSYIDLPSTYITTSFRCRFSFTYITA